MVDRGHRWRSSPAQAQTGVNVSENCYNSQSSSEQVNCDSAVGYPLPYLFTPGVTPWERGRPARVASPRARCPRSRRNVNAYPLPPLLQTACAFSARRQFRSSSVWSRQGHPCTRQGRGAILRHGTIMAAHLRNHQLLREGRQALEAPVRCAVAGILDPHAKPPARIVQPRFDRKDRAGFDGVAPVDQR